MIVEHADRTLPHHTTDFRSRFHRRLVLLTTLTLGLSASDAAVEKWNDFLNRKLTFKTGPVSVGDGLATIALPAGLSYLGPRDAWHVMHFLWGNSGDPQSVLGMIVPDAARKSFDTWQGQALLEGKAATGREPATKTTTLHAADWAIVLSWIDGHVDDRTAGTYDSIMRSVDAGTESLVVPV